MRITNRMMTQNAITHMSENLEQMTALQEQVSSLKKFQTASDDPISASMTLSLKSSLRSIEDYAETANQADDFLNANELAFQNIEDITLRAQVLIQRGLNDTLDEDERQDSLAPEIDGLIDEAIDTINTSHNGTYIFAGTETNEPPYGLDASDDPVTQFTIAGNIQRTNGLSKTISLNFHADDVFGNFLTAMADARDALAANDTTALRTTLTALQSSMEEISQYRTLNGARMRQVEVATDHLESTKLQTKNLLSQSEDINMAEGISLLTSQQTTYQVVLEVSQRAISTMSLFDYLS